MYPKGKRDHEYEISEESVSLRVCYVKYHIATSVKIVKRSRDGGAKVYNESDTRII